MAELALMVLPATVSTPKFAMPPPDGAALSMIWLWSTFRTPTFPNPPPSRFAELPQIVLATSFRVPSFRRPPPDSTLLPPVRISPSILTLAPPRICRTRSSGEASWTMVAVPPPWTLIFRSTSAELSQISRSPSAALSSFELPLDSQYVFPLPRADCYSQPGSLRAGCKAHRLQPHQQYRRL